MICWKLFGATTTSISTSQHTCTISVSAGIQQRTRHIEDFPLNGGLACKGSLKEVQSCNTGEPCEPPPGPAPVDCLLEEWSSWSTCSAKCGGGVTKRHRKIATYPAFGGAGCDGDLEEVEPCNEALCREDVPPHDVPVNCEWEEWYLYIVLLSCFSFHLRTRHLLCLSSHYKHTTRAGV